MGNILRYAFRAVVVWPVVSIVLGLNVRHRERLPTRGPAILAANHNSHLDTLVLMSLLPWQLTPKVRPVAAAEYFLSNPVLSWCSRHLVGILPLRRGERSRPIEERLAPMMAALEQGDILIIFPEGSRGEPERLSELKSGVAYFAHHAPHVPIIPIVLHGLGKALPKGEAVLVPFFCDVLVGEPVPPLLDREAFMASLKARMLALVEEGAFPAWT